MAYVGDAVSCWRWLGRDPCTVLVDDDALHVIESRPQGSKESAFNDSRGERGFDGEEVNRVDVD